MSFDVRVLGGSSTRLGQSRHRRDAFLRSTCGNIGEHGGRTGRTRALRSPAGPQLALLSPAESAVVDQACKCLVSASTEVSSCRSDNHVTTYLGVQHAQSMPYAATAYASIRGEGWGKGHGRAEEVRMRAVGRTYRNVRNRSRGTLVIETHNCNAARGLPARCGYANGSLGMHRSFCGENSRSLRLTSLLYHLPTLFLCECRVIVQATLFIRYASSPHHCAVAGKHTYLQ